MAPVHPQDTVDVPLAARREAHYDCEFALDAVEPVQWVDPAPVTGAGVAELEPLPADAPLGRLAGSVEALLAVSANFSLSFDDHGRPLLQGLAKATVVQPCQRCLESVEIRVQATLASVIWLGSEPPSELTNGELDVILSPNSEMSFAELVEDDLLLAIPQQACQLDECPRLPEFKFPAPGYVAAGGAQQRLGPDDRAAEATEDELADDRQRPFAGLRDLLGGQSDD